MYVNSFFLWLYLYVLFFYLSDIGFFFLYLNENIRYDIFRWIIYLSSFIITYIYYNKYIKKICLNKIYFNKYDVISIIFLCTIYFTKAFFPDLSFDTVVYHIGLQKGVFNHVFNNDYLPLGAGNLFFSLPDRLFYFWREFLGYRCGTFFNLIIGIIIYYQAKRIINTFCDNAFVPILSLLSLLTVNFIMEISGTYMVDLIAIPFLMELVRLSIFERIDYDKYFVYVASLFSISLILKLTNIVYLLILGIIFIFVYRKSVNIRNLCYSLLILLLPMSIYLMYSYIESGSPVFPLYNGFFSSPYWEDVNFKDKRWGPSNIIEFIFWPIYIVFMPDYRNMEANPIHIEGYIVVFLMVWYSIGNVIYKCVKKHFDEVSPCEWLSVGVYCMMFLWEATTGHNRYFMFGFMIMNIVFIYNIVRIWNKRIILKIISLLMISAYVSSAWFTIERIVLDGVEYSWREYNNEKFFHELPRAFSDKKIGSSNFLDNADIILTTDSCNSLIKEIFPQETPVINLLALGHSKEYIKDEVKNRINIALTDSELKVIEASGNMYSLEEYINYLNNNNWRIMEMETIKSNIHTVNSPFVAKISIGENNQYLNLNNNQYMSNNVKAGRYKIQLWVNRYEPINLEAEYFININILGGDKTLAVKNVRILNKGWEMIEEHVDIPADNCKVVIEASCKSKEGEILMDTNMIIVNPEIYEVTHENVDNNSSI